MKITKRIKDRVMQLAAATIILVGFTLSPVISGTMETISIHAQGLGPYTKTDLGSLGGNFTEPLAINNNSMVVGGSHVTSGNMHAFMWQSGSIQDLGTLGGSTSVAYSVNDNGQVVGYAFTPDGHAHAVLWQNGNAIDLNALLGSDESYAYDINNQGTIVGTERTTGSGYQAFLLQHGQVIILGPGTAFAINDNNEVVGSSGSGPGFMWQNGVRTVLSTLPGDSASTATSVNNNGVIVGYSGTGSLSHAYAYQAVEWRNGTITNLGTLGGFAAFAYSINNYDQVVGSSVVSMDVSSDYHTFLWRNNSMSDLGVDGSPYTEARGINDKQQIIVRTDDSSGTHAQLWTPTDDTAPTLNLPSTITVNAVSPQGTTVSYTVTATDPDNSSSELTINCSPESGSAFPIGTTTVNCSANDPVGNTTIGSFSIVVNSASTQATNLMTLTDSLSLAPGTQNSLDAKLQAVQSALSSNDTGTACSTLTAFINEANAQSGKKLTTEQATQLTSAAEQIKATLGC